MRLKRGLGLLAVLVGLNSLSGCAIFHELQPHRLWRLNQGPDRSRGTAYFSVASPEPTGRESRTH